MRIRAKAGSLVLILTLALSSTAAAKGPSEGRICGKSKCVSIRGYDAVAPFMTWWQLPFSQRRAPEPAPFFRVVLRQVDPEPITWTLLYAPKRNMMRITQSRVPPYHTGVGPYWRAIPLGARAALRGATAGITPFPPSQTWRAT